ncbi:conserved hypothetical protein [Paecilomyces variotii No. 5]|uniref:Stress-response A/B barrel domain-containing protein n=1 Tax=Byssochlamys spectabilis (strain No. 5 / NBRC 109023) TaxID=1356009 RepID=V5G7U0_BYSSN|nr:conserved hypothetical protein [Paecilomyces variotii No. 5]
MTLIHIVLFKFRPDVSDDHKKTFIAELKKLKKLSCVKDERLMVGGPSVTDPIDRSKGFQIALVSYHENLAALTEYQASQEHHWVTSTYMFPYKEDLCDGITPSCGACRKAGVDCVNDGTQEVHRSYIANMENRIKWLESVLREKCPTVDLENGTHRIPDSLYEPVDESLLQAGVQNNPQPQSTVPDEARFPYQDSRPREQSSLDNSAPLVQDEAQQVHEIGLVSLFRGEDPRYIGPSSGYFFAKRIFSNTGWRGRHGSVEAATTGSVSHFPVELLHTPASLPQQREVALQLSIRYFRTIHLIYPFLHEQTHMQMIDEVYRSQEKDSDPISSFQIYMVLAIASLNLSRQCKQFLPVEGYYTSAMKHFDYICHHGSMAALQCLLLLMVYALYNPSCRVNIWNLNYQCLASVIDLGLQRDVRTSSSYPMPLFKQEMRTRVFWVVYTIDRTLCTMMGRPIGIRDEACEIRFPLDISDSDLINATANESTSDGNPSHMSLSIRLFRLAQLNSEIKYVMHSICRDVPSYAYPPVKDIFTWQRDMMRTLEEWYDNALQHAGDRDSGMKEYCIAKYHELMILLLRPSPAIPDPADEIFDICSDHAFALLQCFGDLHSGHTALHLEIPEDGIEILNRPTLQVILQPRGLLKIMKIQITGEKEGGRFDSTNAAISKLTMAFDSGITPAHRGWHVRKSLLGFNNPPLPLSFENTGSFFQSTEVDRFISWYCQYYHFWFPFVDIAEIMTSLQNLRSCKASPPGSTALIAAICYTASCSSSASNDFQPTTSISSSSWRNMASQLLFDSGYPSRPNLNTIRAAFLLAAPSMAEGELNPDPGPVCVLFRAAQSLGLHREPMSFELSLREADFSRILWWSIHVLDMSYAVAHALPPLIHPMTTDVRMVDCGNSLERKLFNTMIRITLLICSTLHDIYGVRQPTYNDIQRLDHESLKIATEEVSDSQHAEMTTLERFVSMSRRMCCCKMLFILHQPYLRTPQWPQGSRIKALNACQDFIGGFLAGVTDPTLSPYRWVLNHFNVIHPCAIILQDLIQHPGSLESDTLRNLVEKCFSTFSKDSHQDWTRLETLRSKAWAANCWNVDEQKNLNLPEGDVSLADWDPLFASFIWEELLM